MQEKITPVPSQEFRYLEIGGRFYKTPNPELPVNLERRLQTRRYNRNVWRPFERHRTPELFLGGSKPASVCRQPRHSRSRRPRPRQTREVPHVETAAHVKGYCPRDCRRRGQASARKATSEFNGDQAVVENPGPILRLAMRPKISRLSDNKKESHSLDALHSSFAQPQQPQAPLVNRPPPMRSRPLAASNGERNKSHGDNPASAAGDDASAPIQTVQADDLTDLIASETEYAMSLSYEELLEELRLLDRPASPDPLRDYTPANEENDIADDETDWGDDD